MSSALLVFGGQSYFWTAYNGLPISYMLTQQKFRLMNLGVLSEPLPEMVDIPVSIGKCQVEDVTRVDISKKLTDIAIPLTKKIPQESFALSKYEITYEQYDYYVWQHEPILMRNHLSYPRGLTNDGNEREQLAVTSVSWNDANGYVQWLSVKTGNHYRLPTEVEWEYAARGGGTTDYWWGNRIGKNNANCLDCGSQWDNKFVAPVGSFRANPFGLHDTAGNVWEWTCSEWQTDFYDNQYECAKPEASNRRILRGGVE